MVTRKTCAGSTRGRRLPGLAAWVGLLPALAGLAGEPVAGPWFGFAPLPGTNALPAAADPGSEEAVLPFRARLGQGTNRVRVQCEPNGQRAKFCVRVCTQGATIAGSEPVEGPATVGYRGDGSGRYPDVNPVTAWDLEKNINVLWRTPLLWAKAQPVIAGDRVFVTEEPQLLTCLDKQTGRVLWRREADVFDFTNAAARVEAAALREAALKTLDAKAHREWVEHVRTTTRPCATATGPR